MHIVVAGCGGVGSQLAEYISEEGHRVAVVDRDPDSFNHLKKTFKGDSLVGDVLHEAVLVKAGIKKASGFAAVTRYDETNLAVADAAMNEYKVPRVVSRLVDPARESAFARKHIDYIDSTTMIADRIRSQLFQSPDSIVQQDRPEAGIQVIEFGIGDEADGKPAGSLTYGISSRLLVLLRENKVLPFDQDTPLRKGDRVVLTLRKEGWRTVRECMGSDLDEAACPGVTAHSLAAAAVADEQPGVKVLVAGCSQVGAYLAHTLDREGQLVILIDPDPELFKRVSPEYTGRLIEGDIFDEDTLKKAGIKEADAFVAVSKSDEANRKAVEAAKNSFGVLHVMSRVFEPTEEPAYQELGLPYICGTRMMARALLERLLNPVVRAKSSCLFNKYELVEFECPKAWDRKKVHTASKAIRLTFAYIVRRSTGYMPEKNFVLRESDAITALVTSKRIRRLEKNLQKLMK